MLSTPDAYDRRFRPGVEAFISPYLESGEELVGFTFSRSFSYWIFGLLLNVLSYGGYLPSELLICLTNLRLLTCRVILAGHTGKDIKKARKRDEIQSIHLGDINRAEYRRNILRGTLKLTLTNGHEFIANFYEKQPSNLAHAIAKAISIGP